MKKLTKRGQILLYGLSGFGVNMLNLIVGSYLCSALLVGGFKEHVENWTYLNTDLVIAGIWSVLILAAKILDGLIDIPMSSFTDNLKTKWGRRRPAILIGLIPTVIAYLLFLLPIDRTATLANTIWFGVILCLFYTSYTLTMLTYYGTFAEIVEKDSDRVFLSSVKSVFDVIYFILGYALIPVFVGMGTNIRIVALIFLPFVLTMLIPLFMIKEHPTNDDSIELEPGEAKGVNLAKSFAVSFKNKSFIYWLCVVFVMNFGLQLFLSGINEFFSSTGINMTIVMACSFAPVPATILIYNKIVSKYGMKMGFQYVMLVFSAAMILMYFCLPLKGTALSIVGAIGGLITSFAVGAFFSISYTVPSQLAAEVNEKTGICASSMYFAVEGLFEGVSAGLASGVVLVWLKEHDAASYITIIVAAACMTAFAMAFFLPKNIKEMGKKVK
ncbi:MAG: MFS transporter [Clostridia bacterium]|nr:MFS transporter [Clostridia bacterium]